MPMPSASVIRLRPSMLLVCSYCALVALSCGASWESQLSLSWQLVASVSASGYGVYLMLRYALLRHPLSITALSYQQNNQSWMVRLNRENWFPVDLLPQTWVTRYFIVLHVKTQTRRCVALLVKDNVVGGMFHTLQRSLMVHSSH